MERTGTSAGLLVYRYNKGRLEFLLVHPSGWVNRNAPFYIPKGRPEDQDAGLLDTAVRETEEETGVKFKVVSPLGHITYKNRSKKIWAFLAEFLDGPVDEEGHVLHDDWENDIKRFFPSNRAKELIRDEMREFITKAEEILKSQHGKSNLHEDGHSSRDNS